MERPIRAVGRVYHLDANRINARGLLRSMNQLQRWHDSGVIELEMASIAMDEAAAGSLARRLQTDEYTFVEVMDTIGGEDKQRAAIARAVFPEGISANNQLNDVEILFAAFRAGATLITADGNSASQRRGILGSASALLLLGISVSTSEMAVDEVAHLIAQRDRDVRVGAAEGKFELPAWVGMDDPTA